MQRGYDVSVSRTRNRNRAVPPLKEPKVHLNTGLHGHRLAVLHPRLELPFAHRFDGLLIQTEAQRRDDPDLRGIAALIDDQSQPHRALKLGLAGFFRIFRFRREQQHRRGHSLACPEAARSRPARSRRSVSRARALPVSDTGSAGRESDKAYGARWTKIGNVCVNRWRKDQARLLKFNLGRRELPRRSPRPASATTPSSGFWLFE